ncbi:MAG: DUF349 domain-containing protein [Kofleriaceae bacterium]
MGIADFFRPKYRHSDVKVRSAAVRALTADDAAILEQVARTDRDIGVRRIAIEKIDEAKVLAELGRAETERSLKELINERAAELWTSNACSADADKAGAALSGMLELEEHQRALVQVVVRAQNTAIRKRAFGELRDPRALAELAKSEAAQDLRIAAIARIDDGDVLRALAIDTTQKEIGLAAVEKIDDADRLENVANKAKNKAVRQRARKIVSEILEAERARNKKPGTPDEVKRRRAEKAQLVREMEGIADTFDFAKQEDTVAKLEVQMMKLGPSTDGTDEGDERFAKAVERFWKRKEHHESTARSADELRAIAREANAGAAREKEAKPERKPREKDPDDVDIISPSAPAAFGGAAETDEKRAAREAEAKARREEREAKRAEEEARKAAQQAEREARKAADAERSVEIKASLEAMLGEMEALAADDKADGRAVDRVLAQASKAFDQVGKVVGPDRDKLADRYSVVRGKLVIRANERREAEDWARWANVPKAEAMIATAKEMAEAEATSDLGNRLRELQKLWKDEIGPLPQKRSKELWETFKAECDKVYDKVKGVRAVENEKFVEVTKVKEALIAEAEALADSTDFAATAAKLKELQAAWKTSGHLPRKQGDELWKRFRAACDKFFERRKPMLDAKHAEEGANLQKKQALIARATEIAAKAGEGTWGKAIGEIKDLQAQWKEIGFVPRRDADAVYKAFRAACDSLFAKRDAARDSEANAHRAEIDALRAQIEAAKTSGDVPAAIAARAKAREMGVLGTESVAMVQHLIANHADAIKGTELDPAQLRAKRDKLIARAEELLPKQAAAPAGGDVAAQLKAAMQKNAFGDLRFSGRDPIEVVDELRATWAEIGPILEDADRAQVEKFEATVAKVLDAAGAKPRDEEGGRRRRRDRAEHAGSEASAPVSTMRGRGTDPSNAAEQIIGVVGTPAAVPERSPMTTVPDARGAALAEISTPDEVTMNQPVPTATHDAVTQPARLPPEIPDDIPPVVATPLPPPPVRAKPASTAPPMDELDGGWDLGEDDPTGGQANETDQTPSSTEMAGDGSVEGDGLDQVD